MTAFCCFQHFFRLLFIAATAAAAVPSAVKQQEAWRILIRGERYHFTATHSIEADFSIRLMLRFVANAKCANLIDEQASQNELDGNAAAKGVLAYNFSPFATIAFVSLFYERF